MFECIHVLKGRNSENVKTFFKQAPAVLLPKVDLPNLFFAEPANLVI